MLHRPRVLLPMVLLCACDPESKDSGCADTACPETGEEAVNPLVDVLVVADASASMADVNEVLAGVDLAALYADRDYQIGLTTLSADYASTGASSGVDPGEAGTLAGAHPVITPDDADPALLFRQTLLCEATCWSTNQLADDPAYVCDAPGQNPPTDAMSSQYLDCLCGEALWKNHCGAGTEEGLESILLAICLGPDEPTALCLEDTPVQALRDEGGHSMLRTGADLDILLISDEGDTSRRLESGSQDISLYLDFFLALPSPPTVHVLGPDWDEESGGLVCNGGSANEWGTLRYRSLAEQTGGVYASVETEVDGSCGVSDLGALLAEAL